MIWKDAFNKAKQAYQQRNDKSNMEQTSIDPAPAPAPTTWSKLELRRQNFLNFNSTNKHTAIPTIIGRYPVFEPIKSGRRVFHKDWTPLYPFHRIKDDQYLEIWKRYKTLNQHDCTVYLILRQYADNDFVAMMTRYEILKCMKLKPAGVNYKHIEDAIDRLFGTQFKIRYMKEYIYSDSLVQRIWKKESSKAYVIELSKALDAFLQIGHWSKLNIQQRLELGQNQQLAQSFHLYLTVNQCPTGGKWFKWDRDLWPVWGQNYRDKNAFIWNFKKYALNPLVNIGFIKTAQENKNKTAVCVVW